MVNRKKSRQTKAIPAVPDLNLDDDTEFKKFCKEHGEDYDKLHTEAGKHFASKKRIPFSGKLTVEQKRIMAREDINAFDPKKIKTQTKTYCKENGIDYDKLVKDASKHFTSDLPPSKQKPRKLTKAEIDALIKDDDAAFGEGNMG